MMNDKCAAGTGRGMEVIADLLAVPIDDVGELSLRVAVEPPAVSSTCVVFAKSEAVGLLRRGWGKPEVLAAYCSAMAHRAANLVRRVGLEPRFAVTGGIAKNVGIVKRVEQELAVEAAKLEWDSQLVGAIGAALFASSLHQREGHAK